MVFSLGWVSSTVYSTYSNNNSYTNIEFDSDNDIGKNDYTYLELPEQNKNNVDKKSMDVLEEFEKIEKLFAENVKEDKDKNSPHDWIKTEQISVYNDEVIIKIKNPEWAIFTDTKSMDPVIDSTANALEIIPKSEKDIHIGDIVAYKSEYKEGIITHRVVDIGYDAFGWYAGLKGDNNDYIDPGKVRFEQIKRVVVAVIY